MGAKQQSYIFPQSIQEETQRCLYITSGTSEALVTNSFTYSAIVLTCTSATKWSYGFSDISLLYHCINSSRSWAHVSWRFLCCNQHNNCRGDPSILTRAREILISSAVSCIPKKFSVLGTHSTISVPSKFGISTFFATEVISSNNKGLCSCVRRV